MIIYNLNSMFIVLRSKLQGGKNKIKKDKSQVMYGLNIKYKKYRKLLK